MITESISRSDLAAEHGLLLERSRFGVNQAHPFFRRFEALSEDPRERDGTSSFPPVAV